MALRNKQVWTSILSAICDTILPSLNPPGPDSSEALNSYYAEGAIARGIDKLVIDAFPNFDAHIKVAVDALIDQLSRDRFIEADLTTRTKLLLQASNSNQTLRLGARQIKSMVLGIFASAVDISGHNAIWEVIGYPGPASLPPTATQAPKRITVEEITESTADFAADVVIVGSGAGGSVIAARAAQAGLSVLVLELGGYQNEADFRQIDSLSLSMWWRQGSMWSDSGQMGVLAGSTLGGGTVINSMVCLKTPQSIRDEWEEAGLEGVAGPDFDHYTNTVWERLGVNTDATVYNNNTRSMIAGLSACGYAHERLPRNAARADTAEMCGYCNAGCQQGFKRSTLRTYLEDAQDAGAKFIVNCNVESITTQAGRVTGVIAEVATPHGPTTISVKAQAVVVAAGGIGSPGLLLKSKIGGPQVGKNLRVHPAWIVTGVYEQPIEAWHGQIQSAASFDLVQAVGEHGFLVESLTLNPGTWASQSPFTDGQSARDQLRKLPYFATWHGISHDHGGGEVFLDEDNREALKWSLKDPIDYQVAQRAHIELAKMHRAAGATEIFTFHWNDLRWRKGEDFEEYLQALTDASAESYTGYTAHQMGSCRMGTDPASSVADGWGQLHDVKGVWIGDGSALPSAPGVNPMITIMALAERTSQALIKDLATKK